MVSAEDIKAMAEVVVYSMTGCQPCKATKRFLNERNIPFEERDVSASPEALAEVQRLGYRAVPVVVVGDQHWQGFNPTRLRVLTDDLT